MRAALRPGWQRLLHELLLWATSGPGGPDLGLEDLSRRGAGGCGSLRGVIGMVVGELRVGRAPGAAVPLLRPAGLIRA
jgi:hypothetical protein